MEKIATSDFGIASLYLSNQDRKKYQFLPLNTRDTLADNNDSNCIYIGRKIIPRGNFNSKIYCGVFRNTGVCVQNIPGVYQHAEKVFHDIDRVRRVGKHCNVLTLFYGTLLDHQLFLVTERWEINLEKFIAENTIHDNDHVDICRQCAQGLEFLHENDIVHGNLKPSNVLIDSEFLRVKLSDFGMLNITTELLQSYVNNGNIIGVLDWMAAEMLECIENDGINAKQNPKTDIFSLGCVFFYTISNGLHPFGKILERLDNIVKGEPSQLAENVISTATARLLLISWMISYDAQSRPVTSEVLAHPWFWCARKCLTFIKTVSDMRSKDLVAQILVNKIDLPLMQTCILEWKRSLNEEMLSYLSIGKNITDTTTIEDVLSCLSHVITNFTTLSDKCKEIFENSFENLHPYINYYFPFLITMMWINFQIYKQKELKNYYGNHGLISVPEIWQSKYLEMSTIIRNKRISSSGSDFKANYFDANIKSEVPQMHGQNLNIKLENMTYYNMEDIGSGGYGRVIEVLHMPTQQTLVVKKIKLARMQKNSGVLLNDLKVMLESHDCNSIVCCISYFISNTNVWICMQRMETCLAKLIKNLKRPIPVGIIGKVATATITALNYLQVKHNVSHGNIKPSNILVDVFGNFKISDLGVFGKPSKYKMSAASASEDRVGSQSPYYAIQEDVWSVGITLLEVSTGKHPYQDSSIGFYKTITNILDDESPLFEHDHYTHLYTSFVHLCLMYSFLMRSDYKLLLNHDFVKVSTISASDLKGWLRETLEHKSDFNAPV